MRNALQALRLALTIHTVGIRLTLETHQRSSAGWAEFRETPGQRSGVALGEYGADNLGDYVAGLADYHGIAGPYISSRDVVFVMECCYGNS
ncbi:unannotated protein [freshwater metagenome]|uniref:Unannotated protein n=1 Tax=freshwater metagenome TaxID=449393 RepID=A0A6J7PYK8_9ZZZZ